MGHQTFGHVFEHWLLWKNIIQNMIRIHTQKFPTKIIYDIGIQYNLLNEFLLMLIRIELLD